MPATRAAASGEGIRGFGRESAAAEIKSEKAFDAAIDPAEMRSWLQELSSAPNQVGSPHDRANADFLLARFKEWGWDARIETFTVLYPTPKAVALEMLAPEPFRARLTEGTPEAGALPPYNVFGADGDVTGDLVYVNFGMPDDYALLARLGVDVSGKVVIARYGAGWRGLKVKLAAEHGAAACILYSDPHEDGYFLGDVYPKGPNRPEDGVQRGSVADTTLYTGDPLTPGTASTPEAARIALSEAKTLMKIPVLPIGYGDARPLLAALAGPVAPGSWRGALPITYHVGPGPAKVHLTISSDWGQKEIYDVVAVMEGSESPNQWVLRGNHHDAWVRGAWDPLSGTVSLMAEAKAIGALAKAGWRPKRTLVYASWDAEEPGLIGSTEWAEAHAGELQRKAILYVNSDTNARGFLRAKGSQAFQRLVNEAARDVTDPETGASVLERRRALENVHPARPGAGAEDEAVAAAAEAGGDLPLAPMGTGSDYTPFLQHLGISAVDLEFGGEAANEGIYHSAYDNFDHFERFGDPGFAYSAALARTAGRIVLRAADAEVIPVRFRDLSDAVARYAADAEKLVDHERAGAERVGRWVDDGSFKLAADPQAPEAAPERPAEVPRIDFRALNAAVARLRTSADACDRALERAAAGAAGISPDQVAEANHLVQGFEQTLLLKDGLPGRPWFRHALYAPGVATGYSAKTLPAIREAVETGHWKEVPDAVAGAAAAVAAAAARIEEAGLRTAPRLGTGPAEGGPTPTPPNDA
jgi:N-acetylated-alpha-linked acidic dipeptidase